MDVNKIFNQNADHSFAEKMQLRKVKVMEVSNYENYVHGGADLYVEDAVHATIQFAYTVLSIIRCRFQSFS